MNILKNIISPGFISISILFNSTSSQTSELLETKINQTPRTNIEVMQTLIARIILKVTEESKMKSPDSVEIIFSKNSDDDWIAKQAILTELKTLGYVVYYASDSSSISNNMIEINNADYHVNYDSMYNDGFWGKKKVRRTILTELAIQTINKKSGEVLFNGIIRDSQIDTVAVDDIHSIELSATKSTQGNIPPDNFLSRYVEPFVIIGATGLAVFLFFHVRTQ